MALYPDRDYNLEIDISYYVNSITGPDVTYMERGGIVHASTTASGTGSSMDDASMTVEYPANSSGRVPVGILLSDVRNYDLSRQWLNPGRDEVQVGMKVPVATKGWVVTDAIDPNGRPTGTVPIAAYNGPSGLLTVTNATGRTQVGRFLSRVNSDGYAKVDLNLR